MMDTLQLKALLSMFEMQIKDPGPCVMTNGLTEAINDICSQYFDVNEHPKLINKFLHMVDTDPIIRKKIVDLYDNIVDTFSKYKID